MRNSVKGVLQDGLDNVQKCQKGECSINGFVPHLKSPIESISQSRSLN